jgi:micrococcal nuclease
MKLKNILKQSLVASLVVVQNLLIYISPASAQEALFRGEVVAVTDGDTIKVMHDGAPEKIRLAGIDCPEKKQAFGTQAKKHTGDLCFQKQVTVIPHGHDRYSRTIADITLPNGKNLNAQLVEDGFAWWYRKYAPTDKNLEKLETQARNQKRGLWQDPSPIAPWEFRHKKSSVKASQ